MQIAEQNIEKFVNDIPYCETIDDFCLGNTLEEAGNIISILIEKRGNLNVELDK